MGWDSTVGASTRHGLDSSRFEPRWGKDIFPSPLLGPIQPPVQWVPVLFRGLSGRGVVFTTHRLLVLRLLYFRRVPACRVTVRPLPLPLPSSCLSRCFVTYKN